MITSFEQWIEEIVSTDNLCSDYYEKVKQSLSNKQLVDIVTDANGMSYLCEMDSKGISLPYEIITKRFSSFINGKYTAKHETDNGRYYTSSIYCCFQGDVNAETTLLTLLGCKTTVVVRTNHIIKVYADKNTELNICCPATSKAIVYYWGEEPEYSGNVELVKINYKIEITD